MLVREFELQTFRIISLEKGIIPLVPPNYWLNCYTTGFGVV